MHGLDKINMELYKTIVYLAKQNGIDSIDFLKDVKLVDEGGGPFIKEWNLDIPQPTDAELSTAEPLMEEAEDAVAYQSKRAEAYPSISDQLDMQYWDKVNGTTTWSDAIATVKAEFPKPE